MLLFDVGMYEIILLQCASSKFNSWTYYLLNQFVLSSSVGSWKWIAISEYNIMVVWSLIQLTGLESDTLWECDRRTWHTCHYLTAAGCHLSTIMWIENKPHDVINSTLVLITALLHYTIAVNNIVSLIHADGCIKTTHFEAYTANYKL